MSSSRYGSSGDRRHSSSSSRRDSPHRHRSSSRRSPSPGPSRSSRREELKERDPKNLPDSFGRGESARTDDDLDILKRMKTSYINSPLENLYSCVKEQRKVKIWTRNYKEVRGVMTGYIIAFDKHWNLILKDVDEVFLKPKKSKTPFLREVADKENLADIPVKVPKAKKDGETPAPAAEVDVKPPVEIKIEGEDKKKKKRRKKAKTTSAKRQLGQFVIRGDNIVMICPLDVTLAEEREQAEEEEEEEEVEEGESRAEG